LSLIKIERARRVYASLLFTAFLVFIFPRVSSGTEADWFGERLVNAFGQDFFTPAYQEPAPDASPPQRRIPPTPFDSPPFPSSDWQIGGTPIIGDPGEIPPWPLTEAIYEGPNGDGWKTSRIQIYGWEDFSWNVSTSTNTSRGPNANFPLIYDLRPNRFEQNQFVLYIERVPDEYQTDHVDWGFRVSGVYGLDYRFMISRVVSSATSCSRTTITTASTCR
jgi:hypothetical protein